MPAAAKLPLDTLVPLTSGRGDLGPIPPLTPTVDDDAEVEVVPEMTMGAVTPVAAAAVVVGGGGGKTMAPTAELLAAPPPSDMKVEGVPRAGAAVSSCGGGVQLRLLCPLPPPIKIGVTVVVEMFCSGDEAKTAGGGGGRTGDSGRA